MIKDQDHLDLEVILEVDAEVVEVTSDQGRGHFLGRRGSDRGGRKHNSSQRSQRNYSQKKKQGRKEKDT